MEDWPGIGASRDRQELDSHLAYRGPVPIPSTTRPVRPIVITYPRPGAATTVPDRVTRDRDGRRRPLPAWRGWAAPAGAGTGGWLRASPPGVRSPGRREPASRVARAGRGRQSTVPRRP